MTLVRVGTVGHDPRECRERFRVVDDRRLPVETLHGGVWGTKTRLAAITLERVEERRLLTADVRTCTAVQDHVEIELAAEDPRAEEPFLVSLRDRLIETARPQRELTAAIDESLVGLVGERRYRDAFEHCMRIGLGELTVLEGARLTFVM